jgi:hypothetical protein
MAFKCRRVVLQVEQHCILYQWLGLADTSRNGVESRGFFVGGGRRRGFCVWVWVLSGRPRPRARARGLPPKYKMTTQTLGRRVPTTNKPRDSTPLRLVSASPSH